MVCGLSTATQLSGAEQLSPRLLWCHALRQQPAQRTVCALHDVCRMFTDWIPALNSMDELWVPTEHSRTVLRASGITQPMHIVPLAVNTSHFDPSKNVPAKLPIGTVVSSSQELRHMCT